MGVGGMEVVAVMLRMKMLEQDPIPPPALGEKQEEKL